MSDSVRDAILSSWNIRPFFTLGLVVLAGLYLLGWKRLRDRNGSIAKPWRPVTYIVGLLLIFVALMSPLEPLSNHLFFAHMLQHLLLIMFAPPLLMVSDPMPIIMWGLPPQARTVLGNVLFNQKSAVRKLLTTITHPGIVWFVFVASLWGWHDPDMYNAALEKEWVHDLEHISFFWTAMFFWWHVTGAGPRFHKRFSTVARIGYSITAVPPNFLLGVFLSFAEGVLYTFYLTVPSIIPSIDQLTDQKIGGVIMWVPGSMMYILATLFLVFRWLNAQEKKEATSKRNYA